MQNVPVVVTETRIGGYTINAISARELHAYLGSKRQFANWIKDRIEKYGFVRDIDYICFKKFVKGASPGEANVSSIEYTISIDMAKELAMVENNARGRAVRHYFIQIERRYQDRSAQIGTVTNVPVLDYARVTSLDLKRIDEALGQLKACVPESRRHSLVCQAWKDLWQIAGGRRDSRWLLPAERMPHYLSYLSERAEYEMENKARAIAGAQISRVQKSASASGGASKQPERDYGIAEAVGQLSQYQLDQSALFDFLCAHHLLNAEGKPMERFVTMGYFLALSPEGDAAGNAPWQRVRITGKGIQFLNGLLSNSVAPRQLPLLAANA